jgi:colanic acid biosynthesis glycosyl transferase WcaI
VHIAYLVQDFPPEVGAGPARVLEMSRRWQEKGAQVTVITGMPNRRLPGRGDGAVDPHYRGRAFVEERWEGIRVLRSWVFTGRNRGIGAALSSHMSFTTSSLVHLLAKRERYDVLIASSPPFLPQIAGAAYASLRRIPLVLEVRDLWPDYLIALGMLKPGMASRAIFQLERSLLARAAQTVVVTESFRDRVVGKGVDRARVHVIPNGVDLNRYAPAEPASRNGRDGAVVGYLGTFGRGQALSTVVSAAALLEKSGSDVRFLLVGDGPDRPNIERAIEETGVRNVELRPPIPRDATRDFYNSCDICLVPLAAVGVFQETIPSKIFEVMACERPLVASLSGEGERIIRESGGGVATAPGDPGAMADAIQYLLDLDDEHRAAMGRAARAYVASHYDRQALADRYLELLNEVAVSWNGAAPRPS